MHGLFLDVVRPDVFFSNLHGLFFDVHVFFYVHGFFLDSEVPPGTLGFDHRLLQNGGPRSGFAGANA